MSRHFPHENASFLSADATPPSLASPIKGTNAGFHQQFIPKRTETAASPVSENGDIPAFRQQNTISGGFMIPRFGKQNAKDGAKRKFCFPTPHLFINNLYLCRANIVSGKNRNIWKRNSNGQPSPRLCRMPTDRSISATWQESMCRQTFTCATSA